MLTSLRGGPPHVARGDLAQDLQVLRRRLLLALEETSKTTDETEALQRQQQPASTFQGPAVAEAVGAQEEPNDDNNNEKEDHLEEGGDDDTPVHNERSPPPQEPPQPLQQQQPQQLSPYARPFLQVIMDPRAAGPHTLVSLRALHRLLRAGTLQCLEQHDEGGRTSSNSTTLEQELTVSVLACKFEQTDAGADEAVEMAIADVLQLLVVTAYSACAKNSACRPPSRWTPFTRSLSRGTPPCTPRRRCATTLRTC